MILGLRGLWVLVTPALAADSLAMATKRTGPRCERIIGMKLFLRLILLACVVVAAASAYDVTGSWKASFDTQIGEQHYTYELKAEGAKLTGKAKSDNGVSDLTDGTVNGDEIAFVEMLNYQGMTIRIEYKGKVTGDEIKFIRKVGDLATEELTAKREK